MRRIFIALPAVALLAGSLAYADSMAAPANSPSTERTTEGRAAQENHMAPASGTNGDKGQKIMQAKPGPGMPPRSEAKGP